MESQPLLFVPTPTIESSELPANGVAVRFHQELSSLSPAGLTKCNLALGDCGKVLQYWRKNIKEPFQCVVTSPPYWGLRDYGIGEKGHQLGSESTPGAFVKRLVKIFTLVKSVMADDGIFWLNIGDSYTSGNRGWRAPDGKNKHRAMSYRPNNPPGLKNKELIGLHWKLVSALQEAGWYLRAEIVWNKPNCQPESVKDRPTRAHETVFMLTKQESYYFDYAFSRSIDGRNLRTVWDINTQPVLGDHPATFPVSLAARCILLSTKPGQFVLDPFVGSGTTCVAAAELGRQSLGVDVKKQYLELALKRIAGVKLLTV